jgi:hypothetical protein
MVIGVGIAGAAAALAASEDLRAKLLGAGAPSAGGGEAVSENSRAASKQR